MKCQLFYTVIFGLLCVSFDLKAQPAGLGSSQVVATGASGINLAVAAPVVSSAPANQTSPNPTGEMVTTTLDVLVQAFAAHAAAVEVEHIATIVDVQNFDPVTQLAVRIAGSGTHRVARATERVLESAVAAFVTAAIAANFISAAQAAEVIADPVSDTLENIIELVRRRIALQQGEQVPTEATTSSE